MRSIVLNDILSTLTIRACTLRKDASDDEGLFPTENHEDDLETAMSTLSVSSPAHSDHDMHRDSKDQDVIEISD